MTIEHLVATLRNLSTTTYTYERVEGSEQKMVCKEPKIECVSRAKDELRGLLQQSKRVEEAAMVSVEKEDLWGRH